VKVFGPKWMKPVNSRSFHASCRAVGSGPIGAGGGQRRRSPLPVAPGGRRRREARAVIGSGEAVQPAALLAGAGQLLGLALDGEIQQQRAQFHHLAAADRHAVEPMPAEGLALLEAPIAAEQQLALLRLQLLLRQPGRHRRGEGEAGLDPAALATAPQQPCPLGTLGAAEQGIKGIEQDRFARAGLAGEHREAGPEGQLQPLDQGDVLQAQTREHPGLR
jgi:hypothetical protein